MFRFDPTRLDLAREYRARPFGAHSPDLQYLLNLMRTSDVGGRYVLLMTRPHTQWTLARMPASGAGTPLPTNATFDRLEDAEWAVFRLRWERLAGSRRARLMAEVMGYADAISVRPGETIGFRTSCTGAEHYRARIVRVLSPEAGPDAPPFRTEPLDPPFDRRLPAHAQPLHAGSFAVVPRTKLIDQLESFTVQAMVWPTLPGVRRQAILGTWSESARTGFGLLIAEDGTPELRLGDGGEPIVLGCGTRLLARRWYLLAASFDSAERHRAALCDRDRGPHDDGAVLGQHRGPRPRLPSRPAIPVRRLARGR